MSRDRGTCLGEVRAVPHRVVSTQSMGHYVSSKKHCVFGVTPELLCCITLDTWLSFALGREIWRLTAISKREILWREISWRCEMEMEKRSHPKELPTKR